MKMKQPLTPPQCIFGDVNEATPDSARLNRHPSSRTDVSSKRTVEPDSTSNLIPPPTFFGLILALQTGL